MKFTDIFIKRPVMGVSLSIILIVIGLFGLSRMSITEYPKLVSATINVSVSSVGTSASSIQNYITRPLESTLANVEDIDYMYSNSQQGGSQVQLHLVPGADVDKVFNNVVAAVNAAKKSLPSSADDPIVSKDSGRPVNPLYIAFTSNDLNQAQLVDYLDRNIKSTFYRVNGVASVDLMAPGLNIVITLDPEKISKYNLSPAMVSKAITRNNLQISAGNLESKYKILTNNVDGAVKNLDEVKNLVVANINKELIRLGELATVELKAISGVMSSKFNGKDGVIMTFSLTPAANPLSVVKDLVSTYENNVKSSLPSFVQTEMLYDGTKAVSSSIFKIGQTVVEAIIIVILVMLLFLGSIRALIVPIVAIPISLIGNFLLLYALGYSINMVTLLAIILAIGLVVDDAIVVLENIHRHLKEGEKPFVATIKATREIASPVIVMTFTLAVVFMPIALSSGATGPIYKEFAITLAGAVIISGIVSLTLSPLLVHSLYKNYDHSKISKFEEKVEHTLDYLSNKYSFILHNFVKKPVSTLILLIAVASTIILLPSNISSELTPSEDRGIVVAVAQTAKNGTLDYAKLIQEKVDAKLRNINEVDSRLSIITPDNVISILTLKEERDRTQQQISGSITGLFGDTPGVSVNSFNFPEIEVPGAGFANFSIAVLSNNDYKDAVPYVEKFTEAAKNDGILLFGFSDLNYSKSKLNITIDREKAAYYNVNIDSIAQSLASYLSGGVAARIALDDKVYTVITQLAGVQKDSTLALANYYVTSDNGVNIPLTELVTYEIDSQPSAMPRINQLNSITVAGFSMRSQGEMLDWIENNFYKYFPSSYSYTLTGELRSYVSEGNSNNVIFGLSFLMIFLVLAMQFNSWRDGIVIMITVPLAVSGSFIVLYIFNLLQIPGASMNLYTKIGIMTLVGLITKHGILMCEVAREQQIQFGLNRRNAILVAAKIRFRPILMTTLASVAGLIPLLLGSGTGANARFAISLVIVAGLSVGTIFTLFILPLIYTYIGKVHKPLPVYVEEIKE